ncbi:MAG TPA: aspartate carbamoyltransferase catalytic subunit [Campylobacterales bacterium]|nr:aspartate carbamoyltransferase catalytic subunit [Campylobacterales bacterium]
MRHFITTNDFSNSEILEIFQRAKQFLNHEEKGNELSGKTAMTLFFENSTRTKSSFEMALNRLGATTIHLDISKSSTSKGETLLDTAYNLNSIGADIFIIRHSDAGVPYKLAQNLSNRSSVINGGDGAFAHPTQAMLDLFTITQYFPNPEGKKIAIVGDIRNSRVANSNIKLLSRFGLEIILVAPPHFLPKTNLRYSYSLRDVIDEVDIVMSLRTQTERHSQATYASLKDYAKDFCITKELLGNRDIILMHPGPVHRNIDIADEVMNDPRTKILEQVKNGVAVRMAILEFLANG